MFKQLFSEKAIIFREVINRLLIGGPFIRLFFHLNGFAPCDNTQKYTDVCKKCP